MANNYTLGTLSPEVRLTDELKKVLETTGASVEPDGPDKWYVFWEESFNEEVESWMLDETDEAFVEKWTDTNIAVVLKAVLEENPEVEMLSLEAAHTCSKMRAGEFGGFGLYVTRSEYCWINSQAVALIEGKLVPQTTVESWVAA